MVQHPTSKMWNYFFVEREDVKEQCSYCSVKIV